MDSEHLRVSPFSKALFNVFLSAPSPLTPFPLIMSNIHLPFFYWWGPRKNTWSFDHIRLSLPPPPISNASARSLDHWLVLCGVRQRSHMAAHLYLFSQYVILQCYSPILFLYKLVTAEIMSNMLEEKYKLFYSILSTGTTFCQIHVDGHYL